MTALADRISGWIASRVREADMKGAVVGLSGGVDSAVTAALCKMALGGSVLGIIMPCESNGDDQRDALLLVAKLDIASETVRLDESYEALRTRLLHATPLARANIKPRLRMAALYAFANTLSYVVVGTGNKTELMVGYFTKYGDGGVDILPLGGLYKTQVRELARELGIPEEIIAKPPSAGLWKGQTDEGEMGMTYEELDRALEAIETGKTDGVPPDVLDRVKRMIDATAHKRALAPAFDP